MFKERLQLIDGSRVVVIGGGPSGSFLAIKLLREAKRLGKKIEVIILEKKKTLNNVDPNDSDCFIGECNYCAGGLSPKVCEGLNKMGLILPSQIIMDKAFIINVFADWKNISLEVLKEMISVYRGSKPKGRNDSNYNFDSFLIGWAVRDGAIIINTEVTDLDINEDGKVLLSHTDNSQKMEADFVVFAGGVNGIRSGSLNSNELPVSYLRKVIPCFKPPRVRRTLIFELTAGDNKRFMQKIKGELFFILQGSNSLKLEMISIVPKGEYITVVLIGPCIDNSGTKDNLSIINQFMQLPQIKAIFPPTARLRSLCICNPLMTIGVAKYPYGNRVAVVGDMFTTNLYKDGIGSAYELSTKIAEVALTGGVDKSSLKAGYEPLIRKYRINNTLGKLVFYFIRICFNNSLFSRIIYQAVITERKTKIKEKRRLELILWNVASGEDNYKNIILNMYHPWVIWSILYGGFLITIRNFVTELFFGLIWGNFARLTTGVAKELFEAKTKEVLGSFRKDSGEVSFDFKRMYTIRISAPNEKVFKELGKFGDSDRKYFRPRFIDVKRVSGEPNKPGSIIRYNIFPKILSFNLRLVEVNTGERIRYEIMDGFGKGGILLFEIDELTKNNEPIEGENMLSIYVGFYFSNKIFKYLFPSFMHDVLWNYSLCQIKDVIEEE